MRNGQKRRRQLQPLRCSAISSADGLSGTGGRKELRTARPPKVSRACVARPSRRTGALLPGADSRRRQTRRLLPGGTPPADRHVAKAADERGRHTLADQSEARPQIGPDRQSARLSGLPTVAQPRHARLPQESVRLVRRWTASVTLGSKVAWIRSASEHACSSVSRLRTWMRRPNEGSCQSRQRAPSRCRCAARPPPAAPSRADRCRRDGRWRLRTRRRSRSGCADGAVAEERHR